MSFGSFEHSNNQPMSEINTTPMVDVMLVLLIIFMITTPLMTQSIQVDLPNSKGSSVTETPDIINLQITESGAFIWNEQTMTETALQEQLKKSGQQQPQPEIHLLADKSVRYEHVAHVMALARNNQINKLGFVMLAGE